MRISTGRIEATGVLGVEMIAFARLFSEKGQFLVKLLLF